MNASSSASDMPSPSAPRLRFAPAPTGYLHLGGARTALFNWLHARRHGGTFVLRVEDTDLERSTEASARQVLEGLRWLGLDWDEGPEVGGPFGPYYQSERRELHLEAARKLVEAGHAYECYVTPEELEALREKAIAEGRPFRYEGWHRALTARQIADFRAEGRRPAIRLRVDPDERGWVVDDLIKGPTHFPPEQIDDFVLVRSDGTPSFHLANVADDAGMRITHVIRGEDHLTNTCRHQLLFEKLGFPAPRYGHVPMILGPDRSKLSKRHGAVSVLEYRDAGYLPDAMVNELALLGWSPADGKEELSREELIERFDLDRCGRSGSIFDFAKLDHFNRVRIKAMPVAKLSDRLRAFDAPADSGAAAVPEAIRETLIELVRDELVRLTDFAAAAERVLAPPADFATALAEEPTEAPAAVADAARAAIAGGAGELTREGFKAALKEAGKACGAKGKALFMPVRIALTGRAHGPALDGIAAVLGREECLARLARFAESVRPGESVP